MAIDATLKKYDVFISFRGEDTRDNFTSHLYSALCRKKIDTYIDYKLERGDAIAPALLRAIEGSKVSVIVFSENYASSPWCLDELAHIHRCSKKHGQIVVPVFYRVDPSHVRSQKGSYAAAFVELEKRFEDRMDKVRTWRVALKRAANISGWDSRVTSPETKLLDEIVDDVVKKLNRESSPSNYPKDLVGIERRIKEVESLLEIESQDVRVIGLWGMGGIGKTTLAGVVFNRYCSQFESSCFLANVREESARHGIINLRNKLLGILLNEKNIDIGNPLLWSTFVEKRLSRTKALVVLDDVNDAEQLKSLAGGHELHFGLGSRIVVTTRDAQVLESIGAHCIYCVKQLDCGEALNLFNLKAFEKSSLIKDYAELSERAVQYAQGIPLALEVLGSHLRSKSKLEWENALDALKVVPNVKIHNVLKISYDGLADNEKDIFLDIACFFNGESKCAVEKILNGCNLFSTIGMRVLIEKSLISIDGSELRMHDLIQEMGQTIVLQQHPKEPGKRSRLWKPQEIYRVLKSNIGTTSIEGMFFDVSEIRELHLCSDVFEEMYNLRLLKIHNSGKMKKSKVFLPKGLQSLPDLLSYLHWDEYPLKSLPSSFTPANLVELVMPNSQVEKLWDGVQDLQKLRKINLEYSKNLIKLPDLSKALNVERVTLKGCTNLIEVPSYFKFLDQLVELDLDLCSSFEEFPELPKNNRKLTMSQTSIKQVSPSIGRLHNLDYFAFNGCTMLESLSDSIYKLKCVTRIYLSSCLRLERFPEILEPMERLVYLFLQEVAIKQFPSSIENLVNLVFLELNMCINLECLPESISNLYFLDRLTIRYCPKFKSLPSLPMYLRRFNMYGCASLKGVSSSRFEINLDWDVGRLQHWETFAMWDCLRLDQQALTNIMADAKSRILRMATIASKYDYVCIPHLICYPAKEIPSWFSYQCEGPSINVLLPRDWFHLDFMGFAFSIVIDLAKYSKLDFTVVCQSHQVDPSMDSVVVTWDKWTWSCNSQDLKELDDPHCQVFVFYGYSKCQRSDFLRRKYGVNWSISDSYKDSSETSFSFFLQDSYGKTLDMKVVRCGIHLLYAQDAQKCGFLDEDMMVITSSPTKQIATTCTDVDSEAKEEEEEEETNSDYVR